MMYQYKNKIVSLLKATLVTTPTLNNPALSGWNNQTYSNQCKSNTGKPFLFVMANVCGLQKFSLFAKISFRGQFVGKDNP